MPKTQTASQILDNLYAEVRSLYAAAMADPSDVNTNALRNARKALWAQLLACGLA